MVVVLLVVLWCCCGGGIIGGVVIGGVVIGGVVVMLLWSGMCCGVVSFGIVDTFSSKLLFNR